jgi:putative hydrolase of the HAD superfamily
MMIDAFRLDKYNLFLIDMDDTLYEERDFVLSGLRAVAEHLGHRGADPEKAWRDLRQRFESTGRDRIFNHFLFDHFGERVSDADVAECVSVYRQHDPCIALYPRVREILAGLREMGRIVVVTDGLPAVQRRKFLALGLDSMVDQLICCWDHAPKPDPKSLDGVVTPNQKDALYIGDDPTRDLPLAAALGIDCIRVRTGRFAEIPGEPPHPMAELARFSDLRLLEDGLERADQQRLAETARAR